MLFNQKEFAVATLDGTVETHELLLQCVDCRKFFGNENIVRVKIEKKRSRINRHPGAPLVALMCVPCHEI